MTTQTRARDLRTVPDGTVLRSKRASILGSSLNLPEELTARATLLRVPRGTLLFRVDDPVQSIFFVRAGRLAALRGEGTNPTSLVLLAGAGEFFGESELYRPAYSYTAQALCRCVLMVFDTQSFRDAIGRYPQFAIDFSRLLTHRLDHQYTWTERLRLQSASDRILHYLACETDASGLIEIGGTIRQWAAELGLKHETVYRALSKLERAGAIHREQHRIRLLSKTIARRKYHSSRVAMVSM